MGLKPQASEKEIKLEYFKLAKKYHPDLNPDASARQKFEEVQKAYEVLSDTKKREEYDH
jgi:curved DNA-binding protein CbpA